MTKYDYCSPDATPELITNVQILLNGVDLMPIEYVVSANAIEGWVICCIRNENGGLPTWPYEGETPYDYRRFDMRAKRGFQYQPEFARKTYFGKVEIRRVA